MWDFFPLQTEQKGRDLSPGRPQKQHPPAFTGETSEIHSGHSPLGDENPGYLPQDGQLTGKKIFKRIFFINTALKSYGNFPLKMKPGVTVCKSFNIVNVLHSETERPPHISRHVQLTCPF